MEPGTTTPPPLWRDPPLRRRARTGLGRWTAPAGVRPTTPSLNVALVLLVLAPLLDLACGQRTNSSPRPQQRFAIEPTDRSAILGDTIVLACRVIDKAGTLQWTRDGFGLGSDRDLSGFPRYSMVGSDDEGDFSLQIGSVSLEDDATFQCQVGAVEGVKGIRSRSAPLTVFGEFFSPYLP
ncbi:irregular chiasm C-roughest protein-like [Rhipicephalus microplus]|uniref:irregular chiasm C-roughest protein-like n=1 Tax=Rhipicephalus microplus TaxID=6941 RepID=UPI003F6BA07D